MIDFAKKKSDIISILDGSYEYKDRKKISDICNKNKLKRLEKEQVNLGNIMILSIKFILK